MIFGSDRSSRNADVRSEITTSLWVESDFEFAPCDLGTSRDLNISTKNERYMMEDAPSEEIFGVPDRPWPLASKN